jgi:hypothetical protein
MEISYADDRETLDRARPKKICVRQKELDEKVRTKQIVFTYYLQRDPRLQVSEFSQHI